MQEKLNTEGAKQLKKAAHLVSLQELYEDVPPKRIKYFK
jgi:hypothetical protein